jgi:hypothetical protein
VLPQGPFKKGVEMDKVSLYGLVVFAILMENNDGILGKSPGYILEKFEAAQTLGIPNGDWAGAGGLLDTPNKAKLQGWLGRWG